MKPLVRIRFCALLGLVLLQASLVTAAPGPLTLTVYDFTDTDRNAGNYGAKVTALLTSDLNTETNLVMLERADLRKVLGEQATGLSGLVNSDTAAKIGRLTGAKVLVSGQVIRLERDHLIIIANIIGTETGRLYAARVEGPVQNLLDLTSDLSRQIADKIHDHAADFMVEANSHEEYLEGIVRSITGTNRPSVSLGLHYPRGPRFLSAPANTELGLILQKAGFTVVDQNSDRKPDLQITGVIKGGNGPRRGELFSSRAVLDARVQARETGKILAFDHQNSEAVDVSHDSANRSAEVRAVDAFAEKVLPRLAQ